MVYKQITFNNFTFQKVLNGTSYYKVGNIIDWAEEHPVYGYFQHSGKVLSIEKISNKEVIFHCSRFNRPNIEIKGVKK